MNEHGPLWPTRYKIISAGNLCGHVDVTDHGRTQRWLVLDGAFLTAEFSLVPVAGNDILLDWQNQLVPSLWKPESLYALVESHSYRHGDVVAGVDLSGESLPEELPMPIVPTPGGGASLPLQPPGGLGSITPQTAPRLFYIKPMDWYQLDVGFYMFAGGRRGSQSGYIFADKEDEQVCMGYQSYNVEYWLSSPVMPEPTEPSTVMVKTWVEDQQLLSLDVFIQMINDKELWVPGARLDILGCRYYRGASMPDYL